MEKTHWKRLYNPNYFGCWCFEDGKDMVLTIERTVQEPVSDEKGKQEMCMVIHFRENVKPLICNKTNAKTIEKLAGSSYIEDWAGLCIQLYADHNVRFGRERVDGVRIRPTAPKKAQQPPEEQRETCVDCGKEITTAVVDGKQYTVAQILRAAEKKYGAALCMDCYRKRQAAPGEEAEAGG